VDVFAGGRCFSPAARSYAGSFSVRVGADGTGAFSELVPSVGNAAFAVTATATTEAGNTSALACLDLPRLAERFNLSSAFSPMPREDNGAATVSVFRNKPLSTAPGPGLASVAYSVVPGTATVDDLQPMSGRVEFAVGETVKLISIPLVDDRRREQAEQFSVQLSEPRGSAVLQTAGPLVVTIPANDLPPAAKIGSPKSGARSAPLRVIRGTVSDIDGDTTQVRVALVRLRGGARAAAARCERLARSGRLVESPARRGRCRPGRFLRATLSADRWRLRLRRPLPPGRYVAYARGVDAEGHRTSAFNSRARNRVAFRLR
jgi:Calx-beta domain